jgi:transcriptional regulator with XRE-family HTH domain
VEDSEGAKEAAVMKQIRIELVERDMSQGQLADAIGVERATMNRYLRGHRSINMRLYSQICDALEIGPDELMARAMRRVNQE